MHPVPLGLEAVQGGGVLAGGGEGRAVYRAVQLGQGDALQLAAGENVDVFRPAQGGVGGTSAVKVVVAGGDQHRAGDGFQVLGQGLGRLLKDPICVKQVPRQQDQVRVPVPRQLRQTAQQLPLLRPAADGLFRVQARKGAVQMKVRGMNQSDHKLSYPSLRSVRRTSTQRFFSVSMVKRQALSLQGPSPSS